MLLSVADCIEQAGYIYLSSGPPLQVCPQRALHSGVQNLPVIPGLKGCPLSGPESFQPWPWPGGTFCMHIKIHLHGILKVTIYQVNHMHAHKSSYLE